MIIICVPASMKSVRLPGKTMADIYGKPLIDRLIERVNQAKHPNTLVVCTTKEPHDNVIEQHVDSKGAFCHRGDIGNVMAQFLTAANILQAEHIVRVTGDNVLTDPVLMDNMIEQHLETDADYTTCFDVPRGTRPEIIKVDALRYLYNHIDPYKSEYMTYQLIEMDKVKVYESGLNRRDVRLTVDTEKDLSLIRDLYAQYDGEPPNLEQIITWYDGLNDVVQAKRP